MNLEKKRYRIKQIIASAFIVLFAVYYTDITFFEHTHIINGVTVVHSHFYNNKHTKTPTGGHSTTEITFFAVNSLFQTFQDVLSPVDMTLFLVLCSVFFISIQNNYQTGFHHFSFLRAPPAITPLLPKGGV